MKDKEKIEKCLEWYQTATEEEKLVAIKNLFEIAIISDFVSILDRKDAEMCAEESGKPIEEYLAPYFSGSGNSIAKM